MGEAASREHCESDAMTTHIGYLPDIGRWLFYGVVGVIVIILILGLIWICQAWRSKGGKG